MKKLALSLTAIVITTLLFAQAPQKMNYQAIYQAAVRSASNIFVNKTTTSTCSVINGPTDIHHGINQGLQQPAIFDSKTIPGKIEAESWDAKLGQQYAITTTDAGGGQQVIGITNGSWLDYNVNVLTTGIYTVSFRIATTQNNAQFQLKLGATVLATINIPNTGGWNTWVTVPVSNVSLTAGTQTLRVISANNESCNFNWMDFALTTPAALPALIFEHNAVGTYAGTGGFNETDGPVATAQISGPTDVAVDASGNVYVTGIYSNKLRKISNGIVSSIDFPASSGFKSSIVADASGNQYVLSVIGGALGDQDFIYKITPAGTISVFAGGTYGFADGNGTAARFLHPISLAIDASGNIYVADYGNNRVRKITPAGAVSTLAGTGTAGNVDGPGNSAQFSGPNDVGVDAQGNVYVSDIGNNSIRKITVAGVVSTFITGTSGGVSAIDALGNMYAGGGVNQVIKITPHGLIVPFAGSSTHGYVDGTGAAARFNSPAGIAVDAAGNFYVADNGNNRIRKMTIPVLNNFIAQQPADSPPQSFSISGVNLTGAATITPPGGYEVSLQENSGYAASLSVNPTITDIATATIYIRLKGTYFAGAYNGNITLSAAGAAAQTLAVTGTVVNPNLKTIPGKIEAESWDAKLGSQYAIASTDAGGGQQVVGITNGSWLDYNVNVLTTGTYNVWFRVATTQNNSQLQLKLGATVLATVYIPNTGSWSNWISVPVNNVPLTAGLQTLRVISTNNESCNFNWMEYALVGGPPTVTAGPPQTITLPASQVILFGSGAANNGGYLTGYAWTQVSGTAATISNSSLATAYISGLTTPGLRVFRLTATQNDNQTAFSDVTVTVFNDPSKTIPGKIEAESYDAKNGGLYAAATTDAGGGQQVAGISNGSWMDYNVNVLTTGTYTVGFRIATTQNNAQFQLKLGATVLATINIPNTGGWNTWQTITVNNVSLTAGSQTLRVLSTNNESCNFNWMNYAVVIPVTTRTIVTEEKLISAEKTEPGTKLRIFPNPVTNQFILEAGSDYEGMMNIQVFDQGGTLVKQVLTGKTRGISRINLSTEGMAAGTYTIRVQAGKVINSIKMIKL